MNKKIVLMGLVLLGLFFVTSSVKASTLSDALAQIKNLKNEIVQLKLGLKATAFDAANVTVTTDLTPRISYWYGKVNQHVDVATGTWQTDPDGSSGGQLDKLTYCQKWYPNTISVEAYMAETINTWKDAGNYGNYIGDRKMSYKCVQGSTSSLSSITVLSPNGGETYKVGQQITVKYKMTENDSQVGDKVLVFLKNLSDNTINNLGSFRAEAVGDDSILIEIPSNLNLKAGNYYRISVRFIRFDGYVTQDESDNLFTINTAPISTSCIDSDGGLNYSVQGTITGPLLTGYGTPATDMCVGNDVRELFCNASGQGEPRLYTCPNGCSNGACLQVNTTPSITILSPNGGESYLEGQTIVAKWASYNISSLENVIIRLYKSGSLDNGGGQFTILSNGTINDGIETFKLSKAVTAGQYQLDAQVNLKDGSNSLYDVSDNTFTINSSSTPSITVLSPNGGETFTVGQQITLSWTSKNMPSNPRMNIMLVNSDGVIIAESTDELVGNNQSFTYTMPKSVVAGKYKIQINFKDNTAEDYSDNYFTISENNGGACLDSYPSLYTNYYTPIPTEVLLGDKNVEIAKFLLSASSSCKLTIKSIGFAGGGAMVQNVKLYSDEGTFLSAGISEPNTIGSYIFKLNTPIVLNNNDSKKLIVRADINPETDGNTAIQSWLSINESEIVDQASGSLLTYNDVKDNSMNPFQKIIAKKNHTPYLKITSPKLGDRIDASKLITIAFETNNAYPAVHDISLINWNSSRGAEHSITSLIGAQSAHGVSFTDNQINSSKEQKVSFSLQKAIQEWKWDINSSDKYSIRICALPYRDSCKEGGKFNFATTDSTTPSITVTSPNGGETYKAGDKLKIEYKSQNVADNSFISAYLISSSYSKNLTNADFVENLPLLVDLPKDINGNFKIKVVVRGNLSSSPSFEDSSDNSFAITSSNSELPAGCLSASGFSSITGLSCKNIKPILTSIKEIIKNPNKFSGKLVTVEGYFYADWEWQNENYDLRDIYNQPELSSKEKLQLKAIKPLLTNKYNEYNNTVTSYEWIKLKVTGSVFNDQQPYLDVSDLSIEDIFLNESDKGCSNGNKFNPYTGKMCLNQVDEGCLPGYRFSATTGQMCNGDITKPIKPVKPIRRTLKTGAVGDDVKAVQSYLQIEPDGVYDQETAARVIEWQRKNGLTPDGAFGLKSRQAAGLE